MSHGMYRGFFAEFYDILHAGLTDVDAYIGFARKFGPDVLELGSGTGRILIRMARAGFQVTGIDSSDDMIARCQHKLGFEDESVRSRVTIVRQDVTRFRLDKQFDLIIAPCNFINHLVEPTSVIQTLRNVKRHLKPSGVFIMDVSVPDVGYMVKMNGVQRTATFEHPLTGTTLIYRCTTVYDFINQMEHNDVYLEERDETGSVLRNAAYSDTMAYYFPRELKLMLEMSGLKVFHEQGSLHENVPISADSTEMVFFAGKCAR